MSDLYWLYLCFSQRIFDSARSVLTIVMFLLSYWSIGCEVRYKYLSISLTNKTFSSELSYQFYSIITSNTCSRGNVSIMSLCLCVCVCLCVCLFGL